MRVVIQRVKQASVSVTPETEEDRQEEGGGGGGAQSAAAKVVSDIGKGLVCLVGVNEGDEREDAEWLCKRIVSAKLFEGMSEANKDKRWRSSVKQNAYEILVVSQARIGVSFFCGPSQCRSRFTRTQCDKWSLIALTRSPPILPPSPPRLSPLAQK